METQTFKIEGLQEIIDSLNELPAKLQATIIQGFLRKAGSKYIVSELRTILPYSARTKQEIKVVGDPRDKLAIYAGVSTKAFPLRFVEYGTVQRKTEKGWNRGAIAGVARVEPIVDRQVEPIIDYVNKEFGNEVEKNLRRRIKRISKV